MSDWRNIIPMIVNKIKYQFFAKKMDNLDRVTDIMREADKDHNGVFSKAEFNKLLARIGIFLTKQELSIVYTAFDLNKDGKVSFIEFIQAIRNSMSDIRIGAVKRTFQQLDKQHQGRLSLPFLLANFYPDEHPRVRTRQKTKEQVAMEFEQGITRKSSDGSTITELEFLDFYADLSSCLPNEREDHFLDVLKRSWKLVTKKSNIPPERVLDIEMKVFEKVRQKTVGTDNEGITLRKKFAHVDTFGLGIIDFLQFKQAMHEIGCCFNDQELEALFHKYTDGNDKLAYSEVCDYFKDLGVGAQPNLNPAYTLYRAAPDELIEAIKGKLISAGILSFGKFRTNFNKADKNKNCFLSRDEFVWCMKENGIDLTKNEYLKLFRYFDKNFDNQISYKEFVEFFIPPLNEFKSQLVFESFNALSGGTGNPIDYLRVAQAFDPKNDPEIKAGYVTKNQQLNEFVNLFPDKASICLEDFIAVFTDISAHFATDEQFAAYINNLWSY